VQYLIEQTEGHPKQARPYVHAQVSKTVDGYCPEAWFKQSIVVSTKILGKEPEKIDSGRVLIAVSGSRILISSL
jgi:hypothetical protein